MEHIIVANLKMNQTYDEALEYKKALEITTYKNLIICPSYIYLDIMKSSSYIIGSQDGYFIDNGSYTGEVSFNQLKSIGVKYSIIGHSEIRNIFEESNEVIEKKVSSCSNNGIIPILCVGESKEEKELGSTLEVIGLQLRSSMNPNIKDIIIAYEPIWAIGSNVTPSKPEIEEVHIYIKKVLKDIYNIDAKVIYGGSVNLNNALDIANTNGVDGLLIGGASLDPNNLIKIMNILV